MRVILSGLGMKVNCFIWDVVSVVCWVFLLYMVLGYVGGVVKIVFMGFIIVIIL